MLTIFSDDQLLHHGRGEFLDGQMVPCFEKPERAQLVLDRVREVGLGQIVTPSDFGRGPIERVHGPAFVRFIEEAFGLWQTAGLAGDALPMAWPTRALRNVEPRDMNGRLGFWCFDCGTPIGPHTWHSAYASAQTALAAAARIVAEGSVFALCRPPGHHAAGDVFGGYCYFNNAAIAVQALRDAGAGRVAILDVDYHHGNGTQAIFEQNGNVLVVSLHADPADEYPYFLGYADELGKGEGEGFNRNFLLPLGTTGDRFLDALDDAVRLVADYGPDAVVVSLGVDTFKGDPISKFELDSLDFLRIGETISKLSRPTLFVMEGGYAVAEIGVNVVNVLTGFDQG